MVLADSPHFMGRRRSAAKHVVDNFFVDGDIVEVERFNRAAWDVANFFEQVGYLHRLGAMQAESVWHTFGFMTRVYWAVYRTAIQKMREERKDPALYEDFKQLDRLVADLNHERGIEPLTREQLRWTVEDETVIGEESPTSE